MNRLRLLVALLLLSVLQPPIAEANWKIRRTDRWHKIAKRLFDLYTAKPKEGYALRRLVLHYRRRGGSQAILKRLFQLQRKRPKDRRLKLATALLYLYIGRYKETLTRIKALLRHPKLSAKERQELRWFLARASFRDQRWAEARRLFLSFLKHAKSKKRKKRIYRALIQLDTQKGSWRKAIEWYRKLLALQPRDLSLHLGLARTLARFQRWDQAIAQLQKAIELAPRRRRPGLWAKLVRYQLHLKRYDKAIASLQKARRMLLRAHWLHNVLTELEIEAHRGQNSLPTLLAGYQAKSKKSPKKYAPLVARLQIELGQHDAAIQTYKALLERHPKHPAFSSAITLLLERRKGTLAIAWLRKRLKADPQDEAAALRLVEILHQQGNPRKRDQQILAMLKQHKKERLVLEKLARKIKGWRNAQKIRLKLYAQLCLMKPQEARCFERWGELLWKLRARKKAWKIWAMIPKIKPPQPDHLFLLAEIYKRHNQAHKGIPLLQKLLQQKPRHIKGRHLLAKLYLKLKKPKKALPHLRKALSYTRSLRHRGSLREEILDATLRVYTPMVVAQLLRKEHLLHPFDFSRRKLLLTYYMGQSRRTFYQRSRYRRYRYRRYRYRHRRRYYYRYRRYYRPGYRTYARTYRIVVPGWANQLLDLSLAIAPRDPELHILAFKRYRNHRRAWKHLRKLVFLDFTQTEFYIKELKGYARRFGKTGALLGILRRMSEQRPSLPSLWGHVGDLALQQGKHKQGCQAYQRAARLAPKELAYRLGKARCLAAQKDWRGAYRLLLRLPHPHKTELRKRWIRSMTFFGIRSGIGLANMIREYQRILSQPAVTTMELIQELQKDKSFAQNPNNRKKLRRLIKSGWPMWKQILSQSRKYKHKLQALHFLRLAPRKIAIPLFQRALKDTNWYVRASAVLGVALMKQKQLFYLIDQMERSDSNYTARYAARLAGLLMAGQFQAYSYRRLFRYRDLHLWVMSALETQVQQIDYRNTYLLAQFYRYNHTKAIRWRLMRIVEKLKPDHVLWLGKMRKNYSYRCFCFDSLIHIRRSKHLSARMRQTARMYKIHAYTYKRYCRYALYNKP